MSHEFTDSEVKTVSQTLFERYGRAVPLQAAEAEIQPDPENSEQLLDCPVLYWEERGAHFVVFKLGINQFRGQFYYNEAAQYGTGKDSFDNVGDCVVTLLQVQSDHERMMQGIRSGMTSLDFKEEYDGPIVI